MNRCLLVICWLLLGEMAFAQLKLEVKLKASQSIEYWDSLFVRSSDTILTVDFTDQELEWSASSKLVFDGLPHGVYQTRFVSQFGDVIIDTFEAIKKSKIKITCPSKRYYRSFRSESGFIDSVLKDTTYELNVITSHGSRYGNQTRECIVAKSLLGKVDLTYALADSNDFRKGCYNQEFVDALKRFEKKGREWNRKFFIPRFKEEIEFYRTTLEWNRIVINIWYFENRRYLFDELLSTGFDCGT